MNPIRVKDIVIIENGELYPQFNGAETSIRAIVDRNGPVYVVDLRNPKTGKYFGCRRHQLRLKGKPTPEERECAELIERLRKPLREVV